MADSFVFYRSFFDGVAALPKEAQADAYAALCRYALDDIEPEPGGLDYVVFVMARAQIDANIRRRENGRQGGEAKASKAVASSSKDVASSSKDVAKASNPVPNVNVNVNDNVNGNINTYVDQPQASGREYLATEFEELWKLYPRKDGKKAAFAAYVRARTRKKDPVKKVDVYMGIVNYNAMIKASGTPAQYIMQGSTFFRGERWTDDFSHRPRDADRNKFNQGMESHDYDFDALEKELLGYDPNTGGTA